MLEGAGIALVFFLLGRLMPGRRKARLSRQPEPVCGCGHHHSYHDTGTGECHKAVNGKPVHRDKYGIWDAWEQVQCPCRQYSGPVPLPEYFAPEIGGTGA